MKITTGDKKEYNPLYMQTDVSKELEFNNTVYDFINKEKSFVDRRNMRSRTFPIVVMFQGEDYLQQVEAFEKSSLNKEYWTIEHPIYGILNGHPLRIAFSDSFLNSTTISIDFVETIIDSKGAVEQVSTVSKLEDLSEELTDAIKDNFNIESELEKKGFFESLNEVRDKYSSIMSNEYLTDFQNLYQNVSKSIDSVLSVPQNFISDMKNIITYAKNVKTDLYRKVDSINSLFDSVMSNKNTSKNFKECVGASIVVTLSENIIQASAEESTREEMISLIDSLAIMYESFFNEIESNTEEAEEMKTADFRIQSLVYESVVLALYEVYNLVSDSRQEISVILTEDSNIILLTHKYFGLDNEDQNIKLFRSINGIKNNELSLIKKGRLIKYYA